MLKTMDYFKKTVMKKNWILPQRQILLALYLWNLMVSTYHI